MSKVHGVELLVVGWAPVVAFAGGLVAATVLNDALVDVGADRGGVAGGR